MSAEERPALKVTLSVVRNSGNRPQSYRRQVTEVQSRVPRSYLTELSLKVAVSCSLRLSVGPQWEWWILFLQECMARR